MSDTTVSAGQPGRLGQALATPWSLVVAIPLVILVVDPPATGPILATAGSALVATLPVILFAALFIGWVGATGADAVIGRALSGRESRAIVGAALVGGIAPFCSCEVIPLVAALLAVGTPLPAVMAFWLASPLVDPPSLMITVAALGWEFGIGKLVSAVALGLFGGFGLRLLMGQGAFADPLRAGTPAGCGCGRGARGAAPVWRFWREAPRRAAFASVAWSNVLFLLKWMALAYLLEALLLRYVPAEAVASVLGGDGVMPVILGAVVGMPAYLNGYVAAPMLAGLVEQGMSPGAAMAFLISGPVSSIPAMAAVWALVRPPVFAAYLGFGLVGAIAGGLVFAAMV